MTVDQGLKPSRVEDLALKVLLTDPARAMVRVQAGTKVVALEPGKVGDLVVSQRPHGLYAILDGRQRAALLHLTHGDMHVVTCQIYEGLTLNQETEISAALNAPPTDPAERKPPRPTPLTRFLERRAAGDPGAEAITRLATSLGWEISERQTSANIMAIGSLERIYHGGVPDSGHTNELALWQTLYVVTRAWGHQRDAVNGDLLLGVGLTVLRGDGGPDLDALTDRLSRESGGPRGLLDQARAVRKGRRCTTAEAVAQVLKH